MNLCQGVPYDVVHGLNDHKRVIVKDWQHLYIYPTFVNPSDERFSACLNCCDAIFSTSFLFYLVTSGQQGR